MNEQAPYVSYLPENPVDLMEAIEKVMPLPAGVQIIGITVVLEDEDTIQSAVLAHVEKRNYVARSMRNTADALESGEVAQMFTKHDEGCSHARN